MPVNKYACDLCLLVCSAVRGSLKSVSTGVTFTLTLMSALNIRSLATAPERKKKPFMMMDDEGHIDLN